MAKKIAFVAMILGMLAAMAEIASFVMDRGGIIVGMLRPTDTKTAACASDGNPAAEMLCQDRRDGTIRLERTSPATEGNGGDPGGPPASADR
jgi:hypothetical protein